MELKSITKNLLAQLPISTEDCYAIIRDLVHIVSRLEERVAALENENRLLKEYVTLNSNNSSLPPSRDKSKKAKKKRPSSGCRSGGQPGHPGHFRTVVDSANVDAVVDCPLPKFCVCGGTFRISADYQRHHVYELPEIKMHITEYRLAKGRCTCCQRRQVASLPPGITWGITGPRLTSFMSLLVAKYHLSRRGLQELLREHFHFTLSLGAIFAKQQLVNQVLAEPTEALLPIIKQHHSVHLDKTGHRQSGQSAWLWGMASHLAAYFTVVPSRSKKTLLAWMHNFPFIVVSDRLMIYNVFDSTRRQLCWAHLRRDFTRLAEKKNRVIARIEEDLLANEHQLFKLWHAFKQGHIRREVLQRCCEPLRKQVGEALKKCTYTDPALGAPRLAKNVLEKFYALWTFLEMEGVEPTNNHAERCLCLLVIWRKSYFGTRSDEGTRYVVGTASWITTCQLQAKSAFDNLQRAVNHSFLGLPAPPLME